MTTDVILLWDNQLLFEKLFLEKNLKCTRIISSAIGTPYLPACNCIIIPTGFANIEYTKILSGIEGNKAKFERYVKKGGVLCVFGPMVNRYEFEWIPMNISYVQKHEATLIQKRGTHAAQSIIKDFSNIVEHDGHFLNVDEKYIILKNSNNNPVMVVKEFGEGLIILTTIHEVPSIDFLGWLVERGKNIKI